MVTAFRAELRKLLGLRTAWVGLILGLGLAPALVPLISAPGETLGDPGDLALQPLGVGLIGAMVLGVVIVSSEYTPTGDDTPGAVQMTATLAAIPGRVRLVLAKALVLVTVTALQGTLTALATAGLGRAVHGDALPLPSAGRVAGAVLYWVLMALLVYAVTLVARRGILPLVYFIVNASAVSVSYLLTKVTPAAAYLPDIVGAHMFLRGVDAPVEIGPVTAGLVMTAWVAVLLGAATLIFRRRDA